MFESNFVEIHYIFLSLSLSLFIFVFFVLFYNSVQYAVRIVNHCPYNSHNDYHNNYYRNYINNVANSNSSTNNSNGYNSNFTQTKWVLARHRPLPLVLRPSAVVKRHKCKYKGKLAYITAERHHAERSKSLQASTLPTIS